MWALVHEDKHPKVALARKVYPQPRGWTWDRRRRTRSRPMASTRIKKLARAIQRATPGMKYTAALRQAEASHPVRARKNTTPALQDLPPVLWDGEVHPDLLTFFIGQDLETGENRYLTLNDDSPHVLVSGATGSGKTTFAEVLATQNLIKPMPWNADLHGTVVVVDPLGPSAARWKGRPGVTTASGLHSGEMTSVMEQVEAERCRREAVLARHSNAATWLDLPDEVKSAEQLSPILVVLDEYLFHTGTGPIGDSERAKSEEIARETVSRMATWYAQIGRRTGVHVVVIAQSFEPALIGQSLMQNLPVRVVTGLPAGSSLRAMFHGRDVPEVPMFSGVGGGELRRINGRARIANSPGQGIEVIQAPCFGGRTNSDALDKWLPRGAGYRRDQA